MRPVLDDLEQRLKHTEHVVKDLKQKIDAAEDAWDKKNPNVSDLKVVIDELAATLKDYSEINRGLQAESVLPTYEPRLYGGRGAVQLALGRAYLMLENNAEAKIRLDNALSQFNHVDKIKPSLLSDLNLGVTHFYLGNRSKAREHLRKIMQITKPENPLQEQIIARAAVYWQKLNIPESYANGASAIAASPSLK